MFVPWWKVCYSGCYFMFTIICVNLKRYIYSPVAQVRCTTLYQHFSCYFHLTHSRLPHQFEGVLASEVEPQVSQASVWCMLCIVFLTLLLLTLPPTTSIPPYILAIILHYSPAASHLPLSTFSSNLLICLFLADIFHMLPHPHLQQHCDQQPNYRICLQWEFSIVHHLLIYLTFSPTCSLPVPLADLTIFYNTSPTTLQLTTSYTRPPVMIFMLVCFLQCIMIYALMFCFRLIIKDLVFLFVSWCECEELITGGNGIIGSEKWWQRYKAACPTSVFWCGVMDSLWY